MISLNDIMTACFIESGLFSYIKDLEEIELNRNYVWYIARKELGLYERYKPVIQDFQIESTDFKYTFVGRIPLKIFRIVPTETVVYGYTIYYSGQEYELRTPRTFIWRYEAPDLYFSEVGKYDVRASFKYQISEFLNNAGEIQDAIIEEIDRYDDRYLDLVVNKVLMIIGRNKSAFVPRDFPVDTDAERLISDSSERYNQAVEGLKEAGSLWYEAIG